MRFNLKKNVGSGDNKIKHFPTGTDDLINVCSKVM